MVKRTLLNKCIGGIKIVHHFRLNLFAQIIYFCLFELGIVVMIKQTDVMTLYFES